MPPSQVSPKTIWTVALHLLLIGGIIAVVYRTGDVMAWIVLSAFLAVALNAGVLGLERRGLRRRWAIGVVFILAGSAIAVAVSTIIPLVVNQIAALVRVAPDAIAKLENLAAVQALDDIVNLGDGSFLDVVARHPASSLGWALLAEGALSAHTDVALAWL